MTTTTKFFAGALIVLLAGAALSMDGVRAQRSEPSQVSPPAATGSDVQLPAQPADKAMAVCRELAAVVQAADARLEDLVARMNAATGDARIPAMAALLAALVEDRKLMRPPMMATTTAAPSDAGHHMTTPSRAQGAGLVASGQMEHLMESMASAMQQPSIDMMGMMSWCSGRRP